MGFETVLVAETKLEKNIPPAGEYVFQLMPGAAERVNQKSNLNELALSAAVAEGDEAGKRVFWAYPDPTGNDKNGKSLKWSAQAMKKLQIALGIDELPGETFPEYFARVAVNFQPRFGGTIEVNKYMKDGREVEGDPRFNIFSVKASA